MAAASPSPPHISLNKQVDHLNCKAEQLRFSDPSTTISLAQQALSQAENQANPLNRYVGGIISSHINLGHGYLTLNKFEDALRHALIANSISEKGDNQQQLAFSHNIVGLCYFRMGNYPKAIDHFQTLTTIGQKFADPLAKAWGYRGLGAVFGEIEQHQKSIQYTQKGLALFKQLEHILGQRICLNNLSWIYNARGMYDEALQAGLEALTLCTNVNDDFSKRIIATNIGQTYVELKDFTRAHQYLDLAQAIDSTNDLYTHSLLLTDKGRAFLLQNDLAAAEQSLTEALRLGIEAENSYCKYKAHARLSELYKEKGNFEAALYHFEQHHIIYNDYMGEENTRRTRYLEIAFNVELAEREADLLRERSAELERRVSERTRELELLTIELERAYKQETELSQLKSRIISIVSHEFRTPLTVINSSIDILGHYYDRLSISKRDVLHKRIQTAIFYLTDLLQDIDLVDSVKQEQIRPNFSPIPFNQLAEQLADDLRHAVGNPTNLNFYYDGEARLVISADFAMLKQVIHNLLSNAIKYSAETTPIDITISHTPLFSVSLQDSGIGIPKKDIGNIWQLFYRGSNVEQRRGLGLGLFIARELTQAMAGTVKVESKENVGTTFTLTFPNALAKSAETKQLPQNK